VRCWVLVALLLVLPVTRASAAQVLPVLENQYAGVTLHELPLPDTLRKDLKSGLTNRLVIRVLMLEQSRQVAQQVAEMAVKYDLWDETFRLTVTVAGTAISAQTLSSLDEVMSRLKDVRLPNLFATSGLDEDHPLVLKVDLLLNPIEKERMEQIRKWVAENATPTTPVDPDRPASTAPLGHAASDAIFNKIFEQYAAGADVASVWHLALVSQPFTLKELAHVRP
jgi:hypothetical protein